MLTLARNQGDSAKTRRLTTRQLIEAGMREQRWNGLEALEGRVLMSVSGTSDLNDQISEASVINPTTAGTSYANALVQKDVDMYGINVTAGQKISFNINAATLGSGLNSTIRLFKQGGHALAGNGDGAAPGEALTGDSYLEYTFTSSGKYYLGVSAQGNATYDAAKGTGDLSTATTGSYTLIIKNITPPPPPPADNAGNTLATARNLGTPTGTTSYSDYVNSSDTNDYYKFAVGASSTVSLSVTGLAANAALQLIKDANSNGVIDSGDVLFTSDNAGTTSESISTTLAAGTYFARVYQVSGDTGYSLSMTITAVPAPTPAPTPTPTPTNWFTTNLHDAALTTLSSSLGADGSLSRNDMITILQSAGNDGTVNATELADLRLMVANATTVGMADYVRVLANSVVNTSVANANYLGAALGNLAAGSSATQLNNLVGKWFLGKDHPVATPYGGGTAYAYTLATGQLFVNGAAYTDINQGNVGDCYFLAALGSVAQRNVAAIQNMFIDNGDGTFTVRFYNNGVADYVTVDKYMPTTSSGYFAFQGAYGKVNNASGEIWAALAEKAYVQMNEKGWIGQDGTNSYQGINGGWMEPVYEQILGRNANTVTNSSSSTIINAVLAGQMVTAGSNSSGTTSGIVASHAYIVTGYDSVTQTFTLYNPWGSNQPAALTWAQLSANFGYFAIAV